MARTHSSHTASPTRFPSPQRSPARRASQDGSQYEMDLDALGLNSTFESTELEGSYEPPVDRVDTSEIEGPEDFTMNMTYWMTADLPLAQIKSRKEAKSRKLETRMDAMQEQHPQDTTEEGDQAIVEESSPNSKEHSGSPTTRANGTTADREYSTPASERSMENDEKVQSFLSALPDTDMEGALMGTPLLSQKQSFLQVPRPSPPKTRSLQATVEDYDTPRKPTQETIIHHTTAIIDTSEQDAVMAQMADLQSRLEHQELAAKTRITELETILSYTRSELEGSRTNNYRHQERLANLETSLERQKTEDEAAQSSMEAQIKAREDTLGAKMQEFGEEMRLQNLAKLESQREDFERQLRAQGETKRLVDVEMEAQGQTLERLQAELAELRQSSERPQDKPSENDSEEHGRLAEQLSAVQNRADSLHAQLQQATAEAKAAREHAQESDTMHAAVESKCRNQTMRILDLEGHLQTARFEVECAQADIAAKQQLFQTNLGLNSQLRTLHAEVNNIRTRRDSNDRQPSNTTDLETRVKCLQVQLDSNRTHLASKDQQIQRHLESHEQFERRLHTSQGRIQGLETTVTLLRQQLAEAHRGSAKVRTDVERLERDLEDSNDRLEESRAEASRRILDLEMKTVKVKEAKLEAEDKFQKLTAQHDDLIEGHEVMMANVRDHAEDAVRKAGALLERERSEKQRIIKELKKTRVEVEKLQAEAAEQTDDEDTSDDDSSASSSTTEANAKDAEISNLRDVIRKQVAEMKTLKTETSALRKENKKLKSASDSYSDLQDTVAALEHQLATLRTENNTLQSRLATQESDFEAVNKAMDEKLATMLSKLMKERAKTVVGKRDGQWVETVSKVQTEKELLGKVLLRQWGREEVGVAEEKLGERQRYAYQYAKRT